jgi:hypothetical protein
MTVTEPTPDAPTGPDPAVVAATEAADQAWSQHSAISEPMRDDIRKIVDRLAGATGLQLNPGAERLIDAFLDYAETHGAECVEALEARSRALEAEVAREHAIENAPPQPEIVDPPALLTDDPNDSRRWLLNADDNDVRNALNEILDRDLQKEWATRLLAWARADGTTAQVLAAINSVLTPNNPIPAPAPNTQIPESASADDVPKTDATRPPTDPEELYAWIGADAARAHLAFDTELSSAKPRPEVLSKLTDIIDAETPGPVPVPPPAP